MVIVSLTQTLRNIQQFSICNIYDPNRWYFPVFYTVRFNSFYALYLIASSMKHQVYCRFVYASVLSGKKNCENAKCNATLNVE